MRDRCPTLRALLALAARRLEAARDALRKGSPTEEQRAAYLRAYIDYQFQANRLTHHDNHHGVTA